jgi:hypothetical protein
MSVILNSNSNIWKWSGHGHATKLKLFGVTGWSDQKSDSRWFNRLWRDFEWPRPTAMQPNYSCLVLYVGLTRFLELNFGFNSLYKTDVVK